MASEETSVKKAEMAERLQRREDERLQGVHSRMTARNEAVIAEETVDHFRGEFDRLQGIIEAALAGAAVDRLTSADQKAKYFDDLSVSIDQLQRLLTDSVQFLPAFSVEKAQDVINHLKVSVDGRRSAALPKKKFAFRSDKKKVSTKAEVTVDDGGDQVDAQKGDAQRIKTKISTIAACGFSQVTGKDLIKSREEILGRDLSLSSLVNCNVRLNGSPIAFHANNLVNCKVFCGPVSGSVFVDSCRGCVFVLACQQLRVHSTMETEFYLHVTSRAIIEDCKEVAFAPFNWTYDEIETDYKASGLDRTRNNWNDVDDFNWLSSDVLSPNWTLIEEKNRVTSWD